MDKDIRIFQESLIKFINEQQLPWEVMRLVLSDVYELVAKKANETIEQQLLEKQQEEPY